MSGTYLTVCAGTRYRCDGFDPADWPGEVPADLAEMAVKISSSRSQHREERMMTAPPTNECPIQVVLAGDFIDCTFARDHAGPHSWIGPATVVHGSAIPTETDDAARRFTMTPSESEPYTAWGCHMCSAGEEGGRPKDAAARDHGERTGHDVFVVAGMSHALHAHPALGVSQ